MYSVLALAAWKELYSNLLCICNLWVVIFFSVLVTALLEVWRSEKLEDT